VESAVIPAPARSLSGREIRRSHEAPAPYVLTLLARVYNTYVRNLLGYDDHQHVPPTDRLLLAKNWEFYAAFHRHNAFRQNGDRKGRNIHRHP
jgi:hypothetical protein